MRMLIALVGSAMFPGFAEGVVGRSRAMLAWVVAMACLTFACVISIWVVPLVVAARIAAAIGAVRQVGVATRAGTPWKWRNAAVIIGLYVVVQVAAGFALQAFKMPSSSMTPTLVVGDHIMVDKLTPRLRPIEHGDVIVFRHPCEPGRDYVKRVIALAGETVEVRCNVVHVNGAPLASRLVLGEGCSYPDYDERSGRWLLRPCSEYSEISGSRAYHVYHDADRPRRDSAGGARRPDAHDFPLLDGVRVSPSCAAQERPPQVVDQLPGTLTLTKPRGDDCALQLHYVVPLNHVFTLGDNRSNSNDSRHWGAVPVQAIAGRVNGIWMTTGASGFQLGRFGGID